MSKDNLTMTISELIKRLSEIKYYCKKKADTVKWCDICQHNNQNSKCCTVLKSIKDLIKGDPKDWELLKLKSLIISIDFKNCGYPLR